MMTFLLNRIVLSSKSIAVTIKSWLHGYKFSSTIHELTGYEIIPEDYRDYSSATQTTFLFHAIQNGNILDFDEFISDSLVNQLTIQLEDCRIIRIEVSHTHTHTHTHSGATSLAVNVYGLILYYPVAVFWRCGSWPTSCGHWDYCYPHSMPLPHYWGRCSPDSSIQSALSVSLSYLTNTLWDYDPVLIQSTACCSSQASGWCILWISCWIFYHGPAREHSAPAGGERVSFLTSSQPVCLNAHDLQASHD